jgi:hypothetical protein
MCVLRMRCRILIIVGGYSRTFISYVVHTYVLYNRTHRRTVTAIPEKCERWCTWLIKSSGFSICFNEGLKAPSIAKALQKERLRCSRCGINKFLIARQPGSGRPSKITIKIKRIVEEQMQFDDETTAHQLHHLILRCRAGPSVALLIASSSKTLTRPRGLPGHSST